MTAIRRAAVSLDGVIYVGDGDTGQMHMDALWKGIRDIAGLTLEDHVGGLKGAARARRDVVTDKIDSGKIVCIFGFAEDDGSNFTETDSQEARKRLYL